MSEILRCEALTKNYGRRSDPGALRGIDLTIEGGSIVGLVGPNGSGKTTLIKLIAGLLTPTAGTVTVCGQTPGVGTKRLVSYLPDTPYLNTWMSVGQLVRLFADFYDDFRTETADSLLHDLGIDPRQRLRTLSKGTREKVCLILTMSRRAKLYLLDEPIAGVDPAARDYIIRTIIDSYDPEAAVLIATHLIADIEPVLEDVIFLRDGQIVLHRDVESIRAEHGTGADGLFREVFKW